MRSWMTGSTTRSTFRRQAASRSLQHQYTVVMFSAGWLTYLRLSEIHSFAKRQLLVAPCLVMRCAGCGYLQALQSAELPDRHQTDHLSECGLGARQAASALGMQKQTRRSRAARVQDMTQADRSSRMLRRRSRSKLRPLARTEPTCRLPKECYLDGLTVLRNPANQAPWLLEVRHVLGGRSLGHDLQLLGRLQAEGDVHRHAGDHMQGRCSGSTG